MSEKRTIKGIPHYVYEDLEEFKKDHPNTVVHPDWRKAEENDWVYSDDDRIVQDRVYKRKETTNKEKEFAINVVTGMGAVDAYKKAYSEMSDQKARKKATILLKQERVMSEIEKSVLDVAKGLGIDHEYILNKLKNLADFSEDDNIILQSTKELGKIVGTSGNTIKQKEMGLLGVFQGFSPEQLEGAARTDQLPEKTKEIESKK